MQHRVVPCKTTHMKIYLMKAHVNNPEIVSERAINLLKEHLHEIDTVHDWMTLLRKFGITEPERKLKLVGLRRSKILIQLKVNEAIHLLSTRPDVSCFEIAIRIGKKNERVLNKFLKRHTGNPPSFYRKTD